MIVQLKDDRNTIINLKYVSFLEDIYQFEDRPVVYPLKIVIGNDKHYLSYGANSFDNYDKEGLQTYHKYEKDYLIIKNFLLNK